MCALFSLCPLAGLLCAWRGSTLVLQVRAFKEALLKKRVVDKAQQLCADLDATCPSKLFAASALLSALARPGRESAELARQVQQTIDMAGELSLRVKESEFDVGAMGAVGGSYFEEPVT